MKYGFFSKQSIDKGNGSCWWATPDGREVEITNVCNDPEGATYAWKDKVFVGIVTKWVRDGTVPSFRTEYKDENLYHPKR